MSRRWLVWCPITSYNNKIEKQSRMNDVRLLMKQKLAEKQQVLASGKEKLKLLKESKNGKKEIPEKTHRFHEGNQPTKDRLTEKPPVQQSLPSDFFDNTPSTVSIGNQEKAHYSGVPAATKSSHNFPVGFFDNSYEEELVLEKYKPSETATSEAPEVEEDADLNNFFEEIEATATTSNPNLCDGSEMALKEEEKKEEPEEEEEEEVDPFMNEEFLDKLRESRYFAKLGLLYKKLEKLTSAPTNSNNANNNSSSKNEEQPDKEIAALEKEIEDMEVLLVEQEALAPSLRSKATNSEGSQATFDELYFQKLLKKRKFKDTSQNADNDLTDDNMNNLTASRPEKRRKVNQHDEEEEDDDNDEDDDDEEDSDRFVYNPLDFVAYPN